MVSDCFLKVGGVKNSAESLKILSEDATSVFSDRNLTRNAKRMNFLRNSVDRKCFIRLPAKKSSEYYFKTAFLTEFTMRFSKTSQKVLGIFPESRTYFRFLVETRHPSFHLIGEHECRQGQKNFACVCLLFESWTNRIEFHYSLKLTLPK